MIIRLSHVFTCLHEFVAFPDHFLCHKCSHVRKELPFAHGMKKSLLFFPLPFVTEEQEAKAG